MALSFPHTLIGTVDVFDVRGEHATRLGRVVLDGRRSRGVDERAGHPHTDAADCSVRIEESRAEALITGVGDSSGAIRVEGQTALFEAILDLFESHSALTLIGVRL
ncbi:MAG: hypothetical protein AAF654_11990 [Myxococcota bacterium]